MKLLDAFGREIEVSEDNRPTTDSEERARLLEKIAALPLMDAAYRHECNFRSFRKVALPHLKDIFPNQPGLEVGSAYRKACNLINDTYEFGDRHIASKFTNEREILDEMARRHPGFSNETYSLALSAGCAEAR